MDKLYLKEIETGQIKLPRTIRRFLRLFLTGSFTGCSNKALKTYPTKNCSRSQCSNNSLRSFDDIFLLVKTYYPNCDEKKLIKELILFNYKINKTTSLIGDFYHCATMKRIRYTVTNHYERYNDSKGYMYTSGVYSEKYESKYSWKELFEMVGIKSIKDFENFIKNKGQINTKQIK
jgi:hypothetical protein